MRYFKHVLMYAVANCLVLLIVGLFLNSFFFDVLMCISSILGLSIAIVSFFESTFFSWTNLAEGGFGIWAGLLLPVLYVFALAYYSSRSQRVLCKAFWVNAVVLILSACVSADIIGSGALYF
ncbi:MAG: hypothetical protein JXR40_03725 [Pontiellaceae bacterium]|nr:hypothetical protein [Pontiellaceae bacterium]